MARKPVKPKPVTYRYQRVLYQGKSLSAHPHVRWGLAALFGGAIAVNLVFGEGGILRGSELERELRQAQTMSADLSHDLAQLEREIAVRSNDPGSYEKPAREKYRLSREDELLYLFEDDFRVPAGPWDEAFSEGSEEVDTPPSDQ